MEMKLQQAIVATKAGRTDVAQLYLTQLLRDNPDDANAWFLLGNLVDTPERRTVYLNKSVELDPDHALAKQNLMQMKNAAVPAAVVIEQSAHAKVSDDAPSDLQAANPTAVDEAPEEKQDVESNQMDVISSSEDEWQELASAPKRETQYSSSQTVPATIPQKTANPKPSGSGTSGDEWLVRILVIMVIVAAVVLGILVLLLLV